MIDRQILELHMRPDRPLNLQIVLVYDHLINHLLEHWVHVRTLILVSYLHPQIFMSECIIVDSGAHRRCDHGLRSLLTYFRCLSCNQLYLPAAATVPWWCACDINTTRHLTDFADV